MAEGNLLVVDISQKSEWKLTCLNIDFRQDIKMIIDFKQN